VLLTLLQAAQQPPQAHDPWTAAVALGLGILSMLTTIITSLIRRGSGAKVAALSKQTADIGKTLGEHGQKLAEHTTRLDEVDEQLGNFEARLNETDPSLKARDERMVKIEGELAEERAERIRRREEQHKSDLALTQTLAEMGTNVRHLKERVEEQTHARRR
jgi:chromosome segregation ATPase